MRFELEMRAHNSEKTVGIIGGMGPEATVDLMQKIIRFTPASDDIDHIHCIVDNNPKIPSRIKAIIEGQGEDPGPCLAEMAQGLEAAGAEFLAMPCNTAHHYYDLINQAVDIPLLNIITIVLEAIQRDYPDYKSIGILGSPAIQITKLYEQVFNLAGIEIIYPEQHYQELLFELIKEVKIGASGEESQQVYNEVCDHLDDKGVKLAIVACTELGILTTDSSLIKVDASEFLAKKIIELAKS